MELEGITDVENLLCIFYGGKTMKKMINAFVTNLGKYNEDQLVGEWVSFPVTKEEMQAVFDRIGINEQYEEYFITDYDNKIQNLRLGEYESVDRLNYLAGRLEELDQDQLELYQEIMDSDIDLYQNAGMEAYIYLTYNLDAYQFYYGVMDEYDLGYYLVHDTGVYDLKAMGDLAMYIDYKALGNDTMINDISAFSEKGYISYDNSSWDIVFDGRQESIPDKYCVDYGANSGKTPSKECQTEQEDFQEVTEDMLLEAQMEQAIVPVR